ncbi:MAG TPA: SpoIIE family protein phosphatase, partial [Limnochordia bacterium]|nr:SpoIIE family protein phosphatase [Limnochordia bacterium]
SVCTLFALAGTLSLRTNGAVVHALCGLAAIVAGLLGDAWRRGPKRLVAAAAWFAACDGAALAGAAACGAPLGLTTQLFEPVLAFFAGLLFVPLVAGAWPGATAGGSRRIAPPSSREQALGLAVIAVAAALGLEGWHLGELDLAQLGAAWLVLLVAQAGGAAAGTAIGVVISLFHGLAAGALPLGYGQLAVAGLGAGLLQAKGRLGVAAGFVVGTLAATIQATSAHEIYLNIVNCGVALGLFAATPSNWVRQISRLLPHTVEREEEMRRQADELNLATRSRLHQLALLLSELSRAFLAPAQPRPDVPDGRPQPGESRFGHFATAITGNLCKSCSAYQHCWERHFYSTYWDLVEWAALGERHGQFERRDLPPGLVKRCIRPDDLIRVGNEALGRLEVDAKVHSRLEDVREFVPRQLSEMARVIDEMAAQIDVEAPQTEMRRIRLLQRVREQGLLVDEIRLQPLADGRLEVFITHRTPCEPEAAGARARHLQLLVSGLMDESYVIWRHNCQNAEGGECSVHLLPEPAYRLDIASAAVAKENGAISGDAHAQVPLPGGRMALLVSDGMGAGPRAAIESQAAIKLLRRLLLSGFDVEYAVKTVNSVLLMRSSEESFATVDLALIDLFTGRLELLKVGSAPSFLRRDRYVEVLHSKSLPVGILGKVEMAARGFNLQADDLLLMATDGLLDAGAPEGEREEWVSRILRRNVLAPPQQLIHLLLDRLEAQTRPLEDDLTLVAVRLLKGGRAQAQGRSDIPELVRRPV